MWELKVCPRPAETPLSLAVQCEPAGGEAIRVLVEGGAHIDFRAKDGLTAVHKAVRGHRHTALLVFTPSNAASQPVSQRLCLPSILRLLTSLHCVEYRPNSPEVDLSRIETQPMFFHFLSDTRVRLSHAGSAVGLSPHKFQLSVLLIVCALHFPLQPPASCTFCYVAFLFF